MAKVELKQPVVQEISERIDGAQGLVLVDHRGLTVQQDTELRKQLREARKQERKERREARREKIKSDFAAFKAKFRKNKE